jgi:phenylacetate-CoA ligase
MNQTRPGDSSDAGLTRSDILRIQRQKLTHVFDTVRRGDHFYSRKLKGLVAAIKDLDDEEAWRQQLARIPFTTRAEIEADQLANSPYGTNLTRPHSEYVRLHQTSGSCGTPLRWLDTTQSWAWWKRCWNTVYEAAGVLPWDRLAFPFSFGPFIGFWSAFEAAADRGNLVLPAGGMTSLARLHYLLENRVTVVCCTPTYALHLSETAAEHGIDLAACPVRLLIVAGEPGGGVPATRRLIEQRWGARLIDHAGMTEMGAWGFEPVETHGVMHINETEFVAEVIEPTTQQHVPDGEPGELVLTNLGRLGSPLIRYRTGDQVRLTRAAARGAGRWSAFAALDGGVLGRIDDMLLVRGNNVFPSAIEEILRRVPGLAEYRLAVEQRAGLGELRIDIEPAAGADAAAVEKQVTAAIRDRLNFRPVTRVIPPGGLPRFEMKARRIER